MINRFILYSLTLLLTATGLSGCSRRTVIHRYEKVPVDGWTPGDTLKFTVDSIRTSGNYAPVIGVRTSPAMLYPYRNLWLAIRQVWHNPEYVRTDTVECVLTEENGNNNGNGVSIYQYEFPQKAFHLEQGSCGEISISHIMRNDILPGITEVGLLIKRTD